VHVVKAQRGGSQSRLVLCDDGKLYVLKMHPNPQGRNVLANEALGAILMRGLGFVVPEWRPVRINLKSLSIFPELALTTMDGITFPARGTHFGSEFIGGPDVDLFDSIPESRKRALANADQFPAVRLFDLWANHHDARQCVYRRTKGSGPYEAVFIDNGHLFGGPNWVEESRPLHPSFWLDRAELSPSAQDIEPSIKALEREIPKLLPQAIRRVPQEWYKDDIGALSERLLNRAASLRMICEPRVRKQHRINYALNDRSMQ
jgi:hypothetical protein